MTQPYKCKTGYIILQTVQEKFVLRSFNII